MNFIKSIMTSVFVLGSVLSTAQAATEPAKTATTEQSVTQAATQQQAVGDKLNINTATADEIQKALIGIGAKKAQAIVDYRAKHGNFTAAEQLLEVQGIGKATLEKNKERIIF